MTIESYVKINDIDFACWRDASFSSDKVYNRRAHRKRLNELDKLKLIETYTTIPCESGGGAGFRLQLQYDFQGGLLTMLSNQKKKEDDVCTQPSNSTGESLKRRILQSLDYPILRGFFDLRIESPRNTLHIVYPYLGDVFRFGFTRNEIKEIGLGITNSLITPRGTKLLKLRIQEDREYARKIIARYEDDVIKLGRGDVNAGERVGDSLFRQLSPFYIKRPSRERSEMLTEAFDLAFRIYNELNSEPS